MARNPGHTFNNIALFKNEEILKELKALVTLEPTIGVCSVSSGTPPHTKVLEGIEKINGIIGKMQHTMDKESHGRQKAFKDMADTVATSVVEAIEMRDVENGNITADTIKKMIEDHENSIV